MSLPPELLKRRSRAERYDAAVVGAGLTGLFAATSLAAAGLRVVLVDERKRPGGRLQTVPYQGYAVDLGDTLWEGRAVSRALVSLGVEAPALEPLPVPGGFQVAVFGERGVEAGPFAPPLPGRVPSPSDLDAARALYAAPPRVFAALGAVFERLSRATDEELAGWRTTTLGGWLGEQDLEPAVAAAVLRTATIWGAARAEGSSLAELAERARSRRLEWEACGDAPVAGGQGVVQALVDRLVDAGGELRLATQAVGVAVDGRRFAALATASESRSFLEEIPADRCVLALPPAAAAALLPGALRRSVPAWAGDGVALGVAWGVDGEALLAGAEQPWAVRGVPPPSSPLAEAGPAALARPAVLFRSSAASPRVAPPGRSLLLGRVRLAAEEARDARLVDAMVGRLHLAVSDLLGDSASRIEWRRHWLQASGAPDPLAPADAPLAVPGADGLLLASPAGAAGQEGLGAAGRALAAARRAVDRILASG